MYQHVCLCSYKTGTSCYCLIPRHNYSTFTLLYHYNVLCFIWLPCLSWKIKILISFPLFLTCRRRLSLARKTLIFLPHSDFLVVSKMNIIPKFQFDTKETRTTRFYNQHNTQWNIIQPHQKEVHGAAINFTSLALFTFFFFHLWREQ